MRIYLFIILLVLSCNLFGQTLKVTAKPTDPISQNINSIQVQTKELKESQEKTDSTLAVIIQRQNLLKQENDIFKTTIDANTNIFNGISTFFTIISILLTIIVIAIPMINYFLVIKPNQKIVEKVKNLETDILKTMEGNFESYFEKLRRQKTTKVLSLLDDRLKLSEVTNYFLLNDSDNLEEADIAKIIAFLKANTDIEEADVSILNSIVIERGLLIAEKYYKTIFEEDDQKRFKFAIKYLVGNDFETHIPYIEKIIKASDKGHYLLIWFFDYIQEKYLGNWMDKKLVEKKEIGIKYSKLLFDNENILKAIKDKEVPRSHGLEEHPININRLNANQFLRETRYYTVYLEEEDEKYK